MVGTDKTTIWRLAGYTKDKEDQARQLVKDLADLTRRGVWAAEQGMVRKARGIYKEVQEKVQQTAEELPGAVTNKLQDFEHQCKNWVTGTNLLLPQKEDLIKQMQALSENKLRLMIWPVKFMSCKINGKELNRGGQQNDESLWEQFQAASIQAYTPCKEYFERQTQERESNLANAQA